MDPIRRFKDMEKLVKSQKTYKMAVAYAQEADTLQAVNRAVDEKIVEAILVGDRDKIVEICGQLKIDPKKFEIVHEPDEKKSGLTAVKLIIDGKAQILMKGLISTPYFLKAILNKEFNLIKKDVMLSHTAILEIASYDKLIIVSDVAMIPYPELPQKIQMLETNIRIAKKLGIDNPKAAIVTANEKVSDKMPCTMDAAVISKMADRKQIKGAAVDGPLALDVALSPRACQVKGLKSPVEGNADILIMPDIDAGNVFYKAVTVLGGGHMAGLVTGAPFPVILVSRADDDDSKFYSIVLAAAMV